MKIKELIEELKTAEKVSMKKGAWISICRRHYLELEAMTPKERERFQERCGLNYTNTTTMNAGISSAKWDDLFKNVKN